LRGVWEQEAFWTARYLLAAEERLIAAGAEVIPLADGSYSERHDRVNRYAEGYSGACVYVAAHLNALLGGMSADSGDYGAVFYDYRSASGPDLALHVARALDHACPELAAVKTLECRPDDWTRNAYHTIRGVGPVSLCFEPLFIDQTAHLPLMSEEGMWRIGGALASGIMGWGSPGNS